MNQESERRRVRAVAIHAGSAVFSAIALEVLAACGRGQYDLPPALDEHYDFISRACRMLSERFYEDWSMTRLAGELGGTREHLTRVFTSAIGDPPARWLRRRRIEEARRRLRGASSITEVAKACGFTDVNTLARSFRAETGMSPSEYRKQSTGPSG